MFAYLRVIPSIPNSDKVTKSCTYPIFWVGPKTFLIKSLVVVASTTSVAVVNNQVLFSTNFFGGIAWFWSLAGLYRFVKDTWIPSQDSCKLCCLPKMVGNWVRGEKEIHKQGWIERLWLCEFFQKLLHEVLCRRVLSGHFAAWCIPGLSRYRMKVSTC